MSIKKHIPNAITCGNLLCGCMAIVSAFNGDLVWSAYLVGIAAVLDFLDGLAARLLKVSGALGKQLDSLADMVTFGVVPAVIMYLLIKNALRNYLGGLFPDGDYPDHYNNLDTYLPYAAFLIAIFSAIRLAKFNIDTRQTNSFIGLPTPANAILICSIPLIIKQTMNKYTDHENPLNTLDFAQDPLFIFLNNHFFLILLVFLMSYLLIAELPLFALKFRKFSWGDNKIRYSFLIISVVLLILFQFIAIPFIIFLYIIMSIMYNIRYRFKSQK